MYSRIWKTVINLFVWRRRKEPCPRLSGIRLDEMGERVESNRVASLETLTWEAWPVDVAASSLVPSRLADSRDSCCLWARFPGGGGGDDGRPACRCFERATIEPGIPSALVDLPTVRGEFELWARWVSTWRSTWSPTMAAVVYGNERSWRTCGTSIPRRWAGGRSGNIYSFFHWSSFSSKQADSFFQSGEGFFSRFRFRSIVERPYCCYYYYYFLVNEDNGRVDLLSLIIRIVPV